MSLLHLLIGYMWLFVHRPFEVWPVLADIRLERIYMVALLARWAMEKGRRWPSNPLTPAFAALTVAVLACHAAGRWSGTEKAQTTVENYLKVVVFYVVLVSSVRDERDLERLIRGFLLVMGIYMAHSLREFMGGRHVYRMGIVRMVGVGISQSDPNSFAATVNYALPFVRPVWAASPSRRARLLLAGYVALSLVCIGLTGSRTALVLLALNALAAVWGSRHRVRVAALTALVAPALWLALPPSLQNRFETIVNPEVGPANAQDSAESRIEGLYMGLDLWSASPVVGVGPGAWRPATGSPIESHNMYGQLLGELGSLGALTFAAVLLAYWANLRWISAAYRARPEWGEDFIYRLSRAVGLGVVLLLVGGFFGHNLFRYSWLWYGGFLVVARECLKWRIAEQEEIEFAPAPVGD